MGIGYQGKLSEETTNRWWEKVYDKAASNLSSTGACDGESKSIDLASFSKLTDEELFKACGGRTAHKAARHGLSLGGKLERIVHQEKTFSESRSNKPKKPNNDEPVAGDEKSRLSSEDSDVNQKECVPVDIDVLKTKKRKKHKKKLPAVVDAEEIVEEEKKSSRKRKNRSFLDEELSRNETKSKKERT